MTVEALPAAPFIVIQSQLVFQFLGVALDPPTDLDQPHEIVERHILGTLESQYFVGSRSPVGHSTRSHSGSRLTFRQ